MKSKPCLVGQLQPGSIWPLDFSVRNFLLRSFFSGLGGEDQLHEPPHRFRVNQFRKEILEDLLISAGVALQNLECGNMVGTNWMNYHYHGSSDDHHKSCYTYVLILTQEIIPKAQESQLFDTKPLRLLFGTILCCSSA